MTHSPWPCQARIALWPRSLVSCHPSVALEPRLSFRRCYAAIPLDLSQKLYSCKSLRSYSHTNRKALQGRLLYRLLVTAGATKGLSVTVRNPTYEQPWAFFQNLGVPGIQVSSADRSVPPTRCREPRRVPPCRPNPAQCSRHLRHHKQMRPTKEPWWATELWICGGRTGPHPGLGNSAYVRKRCKQHPWPSSRDLKKIVNRPTQAPISTVGCPLHPPRGLVN